MVSSEKNSLILQVQRARRLNDFVYEFELDAADGSLLPQYDPGAHIDVHLPGVGLRQYSLVQPHRPGSPYVIAVQREPAGRGGSRWIHENLGVGATIEAGGPRNNFALHAAPRTLLIAGGIGLTPLFCMAEACEAEQRAYHLVVCGRDEERLIYSEELLARRLHGQVQFVLDGGDPSRGLDTTALLKAQPEGTQVYCCGPNGLMDAVRAAGAAFAGLTLHFEAFGPSSAAPADSTADGAFVLDCRQSGVSIDVGPGESMLERMLEAGLEVDCSCREGYCGTCVTRWVSGEPVHRDTCLGEVERARYVAVCTARAAAGSTLVLDV